MQSSFDKKKYRKIFTQQHGDFSCGLACLAMIVKYYGGDIRQEDIRNISGTTIQGTTLLGLYQAAEKLNLTPNAYEADVDFLKTSTSPAILHVITNQKQEHYIVCFGFDSDKFIIGDPAQGILEMTELELEAIWKSKALLMGTDFGICQKRFREEGKIQLGKKASKRRLSYFNGVVYFRIDYCSIGFNYSYFFSKAY